MAGTTGSAGNTKYVWLGATVNKDKCNLKLTGTLSEILGNLEIFDDGYSCKMFIRKNDNACIILIVSGSFGRQIIPDIHDLPQFTSELRSDAIKFAKSPYPSNAIPVLFEVKIDITGTTLPYAKIPDPTDEFEENEILLMIGTIYQESTDLISLADLFVKMGRYDVAKYYYQRYQSQFSPNSQDIKRAWNGLSDLADIQGNYFLAMNNYAEARQCFNEQLDTCKNLPPQHPQYGKCYANLAKIYENEENWTRALEFYQKADGIYQYSLPPFHPDATRIKHSIEKLKSKSQTTARGTGLVTTPKPATLSKTRVSSLTTEANYGEGY
ncbi:unnamed protein product [Rotaria sordida]|uniref:Tetratricopeptide repeat protein n=2 Tax=Rotaria sordida TaxID=392033 RepID=A0A815N1D0_9BILA|nr:unnamed protein product [Rotaria sordida]